MTTKFQIVQCEAQNLECTILATFYDYPEAIAFLNNHIQESYDIGNYTKCYHDSSNTLSVYRYHYVFPKELLKRYFILPFTDIDSN